MNKPKKIGMLGGTFNPIHYGHLSVAEALFHTYALDQVRLIPTGIPPHRDLPSVNAKDRLAMIKLAVNSIPYLLADDIEILRNNKSYTVDTLAALQEENQDAQFVWALGTDSFIHFTEWHAWQTLLDMAHLAIVVRPGVAAQDWHKDLPFALKQQYDARLVLQKDQPYEILQGKISLLPVVPLEISATQLRQQLQQQKSVRFFTPDPVIDYIHQHGLYINDVK